MNKEVTKKESKKAVTVNNAKTFDNIFIAFDAVVNTMKGKGLEYKDSDKKCVALDFLVDKLELTWRQVLILTAIMEQSFQRNCVDIDDIAQWIDCSCMLLLSNNEDFCVLLKRRLIMETSSGFDGGTGYKLAEQALNAFRENKNYVFQSHTCQSDTELLDSFEEQVIKRDNREISVEMYRSDIVSMIEENKHLPLAVTLLDARKKLNETEFHILIILMMFWVFKNCNDVCIRDMKFVVDKRLEYNNVARMLANNESALRKLGMVDIAENDGLANHNSYKITDQYKKQLLPQLANKIESFNNINLRKSNEITSKTLYYNDNEREQILRLKNLLMPEETERVLRRLNERGMRGGLTCLLYGGPGTGKTETVNQLAKVTGRDIFLVEMSQMRSKWFGESEKIVKQLFNEYRDYVKNAAVAPILLFNEADALFTSRMGNAERSTDKCENTLQNIILQEMETLDGVLVATTNLTQNLDPAFERCFLFKIELSKPTPNVKAQIWQSMLPSLTEEDALSLAENYDFSGGQIENIVRKYTIDEVLTGNKITIEQMHEYCRNERLNKQYKMVGFKQ